MNYQLVCPNLLTDQTEQAHNRAKNLNDQHFHKQAGVRSVGQSSVGTGDADGNTAEQIAKTNS
jgi:hypothetical protein